MYLVGKIIGTHGIKGELKVKSDTSFERFKVGNTLYIEKEIPITINSVRNHKDFTLITINNLTNINDVLEFVNKDIYVNHDRSELKDGEHYYEDIIGLTVIDSKGNKRGTVNDLIEVPQGLLLEVKEEKKISLIPYVKEFVKEINLEAKTILINEIEGLLWLLIY